LESSYKKFVSDKINYKPAKFVASLKAKVSALEKIDKEYTSVVRYGSGAYALQSLEKISGLYYSLAGDIEKVPDVKKEDLAPFTDPLRAKGLKFLEICVEKAAEYRVYNQGLISCRQGLQAKAPESVSLVYENIVKASAQPLEAEESSGAFYKALVSSFKQGHLGEVELATRILEKENIELSGTEKANLALIEGWIAFKRERLDEAVKSWTKAAESESKDIRRRAQVNLAALFVKVGAYADALRYAEDFSKDNADAAQLTALAYAGQHKFKEAIEFYDRAGKGIEFNKALSLAGAGDFKEAVNTMQKFVDREAPSPSHVSRTLIRQWKEKIK
jgi:tetratricopeptide (TPR) repeat protein